VDFEKVSVPAAIHLIATGLQVNVVVSPKVAGVITLHLAHINPKEALDAVLLAAHLGKMRLGSVWLIAPRNELIHLMQANRRLRDMQEEAMPLQMQLTTLQYGQAEEIARLLLARRGLLSRQGKVQADKRTNTLIVQDQAHRLKQINLLLRALDQPVSQIRIQARIVSIEQDFERELGIRFGFQATVSTLHGIDPSVLDVKLSALEATGHAHLISSPSLFTANRETASIESGDEIPYQAASESGGTIAVFKRAVLGLRVTPQVLPHQHILLHMKINQDRVDHRLVQGVPTINTRQIVTHVLAKSGETIVLGGIYESGTETTQAGLAWLPWLGENTARRSKRELLIFVTPTVLSGSSAHRPGYRGVAQH
jgi:type IV pilus assembly protein PilQ